MIILKRLSKLIGDAEKHFVFGAFNIHLQHQLILASGQGCI